MSLVDLTRNAFQSGTSPAKWIALCKLYRSKNQTYQDSKDFECSLSNSVLVLYRSYPGDHQLQEYLKHAIRAGLLSLPVFVATLLQAARSTELHTSATLGMLCRVALDTHYSSGLPPRGSLVSYSESTIVALGTIRDAFALLRTAHSLPISHFHDLPSLASELIILLLSSVTDLSQVSPAQAIIHFADANDILQTPNLSEDVRQVLQTFVVSLSLLIRDDVKVAREAQVMQNAQLSLGKSDLLGPGSETDIVTLSLILHHLLPRLLVIFEKSVKVDNATDVDRRAAMQSALASVLRLSDLTSRCNRVTSQSANSSSPQDHHDSGWVFTRAVLQQFLANGLIDRTFAISMDPGISNDNSVQLQSEALEVGLDLESFLDSKLTLDAGTEHLSSLIERVLGEPGSHADFAEVMQKRFVTLTSTLDLESFHNLCKILYLNDAALDVISLHIKISDLIFYALSFLEAYECDTVGDPQTAVSHLGDVVLFLQSTLSRYHLTQEYVILGDKSLSTLFLRSTTTVYSIDDLTGEDASTFNIWFKALFDYNSDGIEDTIFRSTSPKTLLGIAATLFSQAIQAHSDNKITSDVLTNGVAYFTGSLLNWTLVGVVKMLLKDIEKRSFSATTHLDILQTLLLSTDCPRPILCLCSPSILKMLHDRRDQSDNHFDVSVRQVTLKALGIQGEPLPTIPQDIVINQPRIAIRDAIAAARSANDVSLDVEHCVLVLSPTQFLRILWSELSVAASQGEMETCRRIATFVLTIPRPSSAPLFPIFLHLVVPSLISIIDLQRPPEQTMNIELLVSIVSSVLMASLHLEWALHTVNGETCHILVQPSAAIARRFAGTLRNGGPISETIVQRLTSSPSFVANFPTFTDELGL